MERDGTGRAADGVCHRRAIAAWHGGALGVCRHWHAGDGDSVFVQHRQRSGLPVRFAGRCADFWLCRGPQARARAVGSGSAQWAGHSAGLELQPFGLDAARAHCCHCADRAVCGALPGGLPTGPYSRGVGPVFPRLTHRPAKWHRGGHHLGLVQVVSGVGCGAGWLHLFAGDSDRTGRRQSALAHHALAGGAVRADDCAAGYYLDRLCHHPADRDWHFEHRGADWRGRHPDPDSVFAGRIDCHAAVCAPPGAGRAQRVCGVFPGRH